MHVETVVPVSESLLEEVRRELGLAAVTAERELTTARAACSSTMVAMAMQRLAAIRRVKLALPH